VAAGHDRQCLLDEGRGLTCRGGRRLTRTFDYDAKIADYWPEFAQAGKGAIAARQLLGHQAALVAVKSPLTLADIADPEKISANIAAREPH
jgi:CubicO group peptidase (beta-lactamase class C family)